MTGQLRRGLGLAIIMALSSACTVTEMDYSKTIGSSSGSEAAASRRDTARDKNKEAAETYVQLGLGYLRKGERQRARTNLLKALEKDPRSADAHNALALLLQMEGENHLAEEHFEKAVNYEPSLTNVRYNYASFLFRQKRFSDAEKQFLIAADDIHYARRGQAFYNLGLIAKQLGKAEQAQQAWEKAIKLNPKYPYPFLDLAEIYLNMGDYPKAKRYLEHYESLSKPTPRALWLAVRLEHAFGNKDGEASKAMALKNMFPYAEETIEYNTWLKARE